MSARNLKDMIACDCFHSWLIGCGTSGKSTDVGSFCTSPDHPLRSRASPAGCHLRADKGLDGQPLVNGMAVEDRTSERLKKATDLRAASMLKPCCITLSGCTALNLQYLTLCGGQISSSSSDFQFQGATLFIQK